jgi:AraC family transcriptional regulator of adaptative response/methylated-DNA-[protein]-cysteine methyltransferase
MTVMPSATEMYRALVDRDGTYEGVFFAAVKTTGIFCRPTCTARKPRAANVEYFATAAEAIAAGYRPCRRCRPLEPEHAPPAWVERLTAAVERAPTRRLTDADLRAMSIDPTRARRYFKRRYGMTFHAYHRAQRMGLALTAVGERTNGHAAPGGIDAIGMRHGFESASGFRDAFARLFGAAPGRSAGRTCLLARRLETPLGAMAAVAGTEGLCLLEFLDRRGLEREIDGLRRRTGRTIVPGAHPILDRIEHELAAYFAGARTTFDVPVHHPGSPFQQRVWETLRTIPYGATRSYAWLAETIGRRGAHRAVGRANGQNRLAIIVPCHRVVRADGRLCGYGGGLWRKRRLLELEGASDLRD